LNRSFEDAAYEQDGVEYWMARELQVLLEYTQWRNFEQVIDKAKISCRTAGQNPDHHFADVSKMVALGSGAERSVDDYMLTRYACYLIAQNGDPRKEVIAFVH
jgi:DNA-damage-inducible protein D